MHKTARNCMQASCMQLMQVHESAQVFMQVACESYASCNTSYTVVTTPESLHANPNPNPNRRDLLRSCARKDSFQVGRRALETTLGRCKLHVIRCMRGTWRHRLRPPRGGTLKLTRVANPRGLLGSCVWKHSESLCLENLQVVVLGKRLL